MVSLLATGEWAQLLIPGLKKTCRETVRLCTDLSDNMHASKYQPPSRILNKPQPALHFLLPQSPSDYILSPALHLQWPAISYTSLLCWTLGRCPALTQWLSELTPVTTATSSTAVVNSAGSMKPPGDPIHIVQHHSTLCSCPRPAIRPRTLLSFQKNPSMAAPNLHCTFPSLPQRIRLTWTNMDSRASQRGELHRIRFSQPFYFESFRQSSHVWVIITRCFLTTESLSTPEHLQVSSRPAGYAVCQVMPMPC